MGEGAHAGAAMGQSGRTGRRSRFLEFGRLEFCQWSDDLRRWRDDFSSLTQKFLSMLAVRKTARGLGNVQVQEMPEPHPDPGQVLMEVNSAGICGTDLHIYFDEFETNPPVTLGHEVAGEIVGMGKGVRGWKIGQRVTSETYFYTCGECFHCRRRRRNLCVKRRSIGSKADGAFTRYMLTPASNLHRVPDELDLESAALTEPLACVIHGVTLTAQVKAGPR